MADGIYLANDRYQQLNGDLFEQNARQTFGDVWEQQANAAAPDLIAQAQKEADDRARAQMQLEQAQRDHMATSFEASAPSMAAQHLASLNADVAPSPQEAPQLAPVPDTTQTAPDYAAPTPAPAQSQLAPSVPVTVPMSNLASTQQPISAPAAATPTTAGISGGGDLSGRVGARGQQILSSAADAASWLGDQGQKALQAVLLTEGGLAGARGDKGQSAGPLQFYTGGQLANFAQQLGMGLEQAKQYVEAHPEAAIQWAIGTPDRPGYLGGAIQRGLQAGLQGAALATYAQAHGQVSSSPERAGQNFNAMFGGGQGVIAGAANAVGGAANAVANVVRNPQSILDAVKPFLGSQYVWGGKSPQQGFDCSGLAGYLAGTGQPESTTSLYAKSAPISAKDAQPGDLVFYNMGQSDMSVQHVATLLDPTNGTIVQSGGTQHAVNIGNANQAIGSAPEYRRLGPGGAPVQAATAPPDVQATQPTDQQAAQAQPSSPIDAFKQKLGDAFSDLLAPIQHLFGGSSSTPPAPEGGGYGAVPPGGVNPLPDVFAGIGQAAQTGQQNLAARGIQLDRPGSQTLPGVQHSLADAGIQLDQPGSPTLPATPLTSENFPSILDPNHPANVYTDLAQKYATPSDPLNLHVRDRMTPEDQAKWDSLAAQVGGVEMPTAPRTLLTGAVPDVAGASVPAAVSSGPLSLTPATADVAGMATGRTAADIQRDIRNTTIGLGKANKQIENTIGATGQDDLRASLRDRATALRGRLVDLQAELTGDTNGAVTPSPPVADFEPTPTLGRDVASTLPPGSGPLAVPAPSQESVDTLQGLMDMAKSRGLDTSAVESKVADLMPKAETSATGGAVPSTMPPPSTAPVSRTIAPSAAVAPGGPLSLKPVTTGGAAPPPTILPTAAPPAVPPAPPAGTLPAAVGAVPPSVPTGGANAWDYLRALRVGSLAGGIQTVSHILLNAPLQTAFKLVSDAPLSITRPETVPLEFMGAWQGLRGWAANAASAPLGQPGKIAQSIGGTAGQAVETGLLGLVKTHPVIQDMAREIGTSMELWRQAGIEASNAGLTRFSGPWWTEVQNLVANPTADMAAAAQRAGDTFSLGGKMGEVGQAFANLRQDSKAVDFVMPFFNIGYHVATQGIERSPIGLLGTALDVARAPLGSGPYAAGRIVEGVTPLAQRFRNNMVGVGIAVEAYHQAAQGNITGNGPDDPKLKQDLLATGWQPDSVRVGGRYFPLHVLGPLGWPLAEAANLYEATHTGEQGGYAKPNADPQGQFASYLGRMAQFGENETFLRSIGQLLQAAGNAKDFGRLGEQEAASTLGSLIPQGALLSNIASATDPFTRRPTPGDLGQAIQNRLPGLRQDLPLKLTPTGQPVQNPSQGLGILLPRSSLAAPDPVINAMGQAGLGAPTIPKTIPVTSKYQMDLTQDEQQRWQELHGQALNEQLKDVVTDPDWARLTQDRQRQLIQKALTKASDVARKQLLDEMPDATIESRVQLKTDAVAANRVTVGTAP